MDVCCFCQRFIDEDELVHVSGGEVAHRWCAEEWADDADEDSFDVTTFA